MSTSDENRRYKWSNAATNLLVSIWSHDLIQKQLKVCSRNQPIWTNIGRYMTRKGFEVSGTQCRNRIKNMLGNYHEAVKKKDKSCIEPYYDVFKRVLSNKKQKKKDNSLKNFKETIFPDKTVGENDISTESNDSNVSLKDQSNSQDKVQFVKVGSLQAESKTFSTSVVQELEKIIVQATNSQTNAIVNAINFQSQVIEKFVLSERARLEAIMATERESRRQLEMKFDKLLSRLEANSLSQMSLLRCFLEAKTDK